MHAADEAGSALAGLHLNSGARWMMDEHTRGMFVAINATVASASMTSIEDSAQAAQTLDGQLQQLVAGCTMDGSAHDELHKFLVAYIPAIGQLAEADSVETANESMTAVKALLAEYALHFE
ncbi:MAG: hypothetical protein ACJAYU_000242 [Bradymonadia bacterium]|jgi:hypothetical protein